MKYNYLDGKSRVLQILNNNEEIQKRNAIPKNDSDFTYNNGILAWTSSIFVDIRDSSEMMEENGSLEMSKILRSFISEILEILNLEKDLVRELGIRGDCVYGIYSTKTDEQEYKIFELTFWINTCIKMLNKLFIQKGYRKIKVGIGFSCDYEFIVKAGRKGTGENDKVWIGNSVHQASNLSGIMNKEISMTIGFYPHNYNYIIQSLKENNPNKNVESWIESFEWKNTNYYKCNIIKSEFDNWIDKEC